MAKRGPKPKHIDQVEFEKLCAIQCTQEEIADWFMISVDTLERWCKMTYRKKFAEIFRQKRGRGKVSLRRRQYQAAVQDGNTTMLIWLGKQYLGQSDKVVVEDQELEYRPSQEFKTEER